MTELIKWEEIDREIDIAREEKNWELLGKTNTALKALKEQSKGNLFVKNKCGIYQIKCQAAIGAIYGDLEPEHVDHWNCSGHNVTTNKQEIEQDVNKDRKQLNRYQKVNKILDEIELKKYEQKCNEEEREVTSAGYLKHYREQQKKEQPELIKGKFDVIYCDPPWEYDNTGLSAKVILEYPTMSMEELINLDVKNIIDDNCIIFMWATNPQLDVAIEVIHEWGFKYKTNFVWIKSNHTAGFYVYGKHELLLIGVRGSMLPEEKYKSIIEGKNIMHSKKPEIVYNMIEKMYPNRRYVELFARNKRENWDAWGNEV